MWVGGDAVYGGGVQMCCVGCESLRRRRGEEIRGNDEGADAVVCA